MPIVAEIDPKVKEVQKTHIIKLDSDRKVWHVINKVTSKIVESYKFDQSKKVTRPNVWAEFAKR